MSRDHLFDDLARTLATPMPRRRALRTILGTLAGAALAAVAGPGRVQAADPTPRGGRCPANYTNCGNVVCCASNKPCCVNVCCNPGETCQDGQCKQNASPSSPT